MFKLKFSSISLILLVSLFITLIDNHVFFSKIFERLNVFTLQGGAYVFTVFVILFSILVFIHLIIGQKFLLKMLMSILLIISAILAYFGQELGVVFDVDMMRNIVDTVKDNNQHEAFELLSLPLIKHVLLYGILPAAFVLIVKITYKPFVKEALWRVFTAIGLVVLIGVLLLLNFKSATYFSNENRDLRVYTIPLYAIYSIESFVSLALKKNKTQLNIIGKDAIQQKQGINRRIGIMVVGETARWDHFSLNGYFRDTNPKLQKIDIINYTKANACGTSTAYSVPCMFSFLEKKQYSPEKAAGQTNVLDVLKKTGIKVYWIENNSSCKGVCKRTGHINIRGNPDQASPFYTVDGELFDEELLVQVKKVIANDESNSDILLVLHTMGSHGPKYYKRYPDAFARFEPACKKATPQECTDKEIINAYDNTILYTDHVLSLLIDYLKKELSSFDTFLLYASDHGESLGEKGVYLHGLPYFLAPETQTHIPMLSWFSESYIRNENLNYADMQTLGDQDISHDYLSHSLLSLFDVKTHVYKAEYDLLQKYQK